MSKWLSRKWLLALAGLVLGLLVLFGVISTDQQSEWLAIVEKAIGAIIAIAAILGYEIAESKVDAARTKDNE